MDRRWTVFMTLAVLAGFAIILFVNIASEVGVLPPRLLSQYEVRGMAVEHDKVLYTLNFQQQREMVDMFDRSFFSTAEEVHAREVLSMNGPDIDKIIIYRFDKPDLEVELYGYIAKTGAPLEGISVGDLNLVFIAPFWNPHGFVEEPNATENFQMLLTTYDH